MNTKIINSILKKNFQLFKSNKIDNIIMAGNIKRPSLTDLSFDFQTFKLAKNILLNKTGDNDLLLSLKNFLKDKWF